MNLSSRIIKAQDVKLSAQPTNEKSEPLIPTQADAVTIDLASQPRDSKREAPVRFRGVCHLPAKDAGFHSQDNHQEVSQKIDKIRKQAEKKINIAQKDAYDRGCADGLKKGVDQKKQELSHAFESVAKLSKEFEDLKESILEGSERQILDLAILIAGKVVHKEVTTDREVIVSVLKEAMKNIQESESACICLNPKDYDHIAEATPDFLNSYGNTSIKKDEEVGRGGAVIETNSGSVDARLDKQLIKIMESLCDVH